MIRCGIPHCSRPVVVDYPICQQHMDLGYLNDYREYQDLINEGYRHIDAAVRCGLLDPPED